MTEDVRLESLRSIKSFIRLWLDNYSEDFADAPEYPCLNELNRFAHLHLNDPELIKIIRAKFEQFEAALEASSSTENNINNQNNINNIISTNSNANTRSYFVNTNKEKLNMSDNLVNAVNGGDVNVNDESINSSNSKTITQASSQASTKHTNSINNNPVLNTNHRRSYSNLAQSSYQNNNESAFNLNSNHSRLVCLFLLASNLCYLLYILANKTKGINKKL
jgi:hypothetical protein